MASSTVSGTSASPDRRSAASRSPAREDAEELLDVERDAVGAVVDRADEVARRPAGRTPSRSVAIVAGLVDATAGRRRTSSASRWVEQPRPPLAHRDPRDRARRSGRSRRRGSGRPRSAAGERLEDLQGQVVGPVQVLEARSDGRAVASGRASSSTTSRTSSRRRRCASPASGAVGVRPSAPRPGARRGPDAASGCDAIAPAEVDRGSRPATWRSLGYVAARTVGTRPRSRRRLDRAEQAGLADPGLAGEEQEPAAARRDLGDPAIGRSSRSSRPTRIGQTSGRGGAPRRAV